MSRRNRKTVELTSLLDLLFVMIFLSLLQTKAPTKAETKPDPKPIEKIKELPKAKPVEQTKVSVTAIFHFHSTPSNPNLPTGTYAMGGTFDKKNGTLSLGGLSWINRPQGYDMVPLSGKINSSGSLFTGKIEFQDCEEFTLKRVSKISGSGIAGKWVGSYFCSQGETGLTLTIQ